MTSHWRKKKQSDLAKPGFVRRPRGGRRGTAGEDAFKTLRRVGATHVTENWKAEKV